MITDKAKCLVIGLDGADWDILIPWFKKGKLPFLKSLYDKAASGVLESVIPTQTAVSWTSFQTGVNPGKHGIFDFLRIRDKKVTDQIVTSNDIEVPSFWNYLERIGKKAVAINLPVTYPVPHAKSLIVSGFLAPEGRSFVNNVAVEKKLKKIGYKIDLEVGEGAVIHSKKVDREKLYKEIRRLTDKRFEAAKLLAKERAWDLFFVLIKETDIIQHFFYGEHKNLVYWQWLDKKLKEFVQYVEKLVGNDLYTLVLSDHGFHKASKYNFAIYAWMRKEGFLSKEKSMKSRLFTSAQKAYYVAKEAGIDLVKLPVIAKLSGRMISSGEAVSPIGAIGFGIFLRKKLLGKGYTKLRGELIRKLRKASYRGTKVFSFVAKAEDYYKGPLLEHGPDIVFLTNRNFLVTTSPYSAEVIKERNLRGTQKGDHLSALHGIFIFGGPGVIRRKKQSARIYDIIPTVLILLGYEVGREFDGKVLVDLFNKKAVKKIKALQSKTERDRIDRFIDESLKDLRL